MTTPMSNKEEANIAAAMIAAAATEGFSVPVDPDLAGSMGAFVEDAISLDDADDSRLQAVAGDELEG